MRYSPSLSMTDIQPCRVKNGINFLILSIVVLFKYGLFIFLFEIMYRK